MTQTDSALLDVADALNRLALTVLALICVLIIMSWALDDISTRVSLFGFMLRRVAHVAPADTLGTTEPAVPPSAAQKAAKESRHEDHVK